MVLKNIVNKNKLNILDYKRIYENVYSFGLVGDD